MLENFKIKSETEYNALSAEEKGEYNAMLKMYKAKQEEDNKAKVKAELKAELAEEIKTAKTEAIAEAKAEAEKGFDEKLKAKDEEVNSKLEAMEKAWKSTSVHNRAERSKTMSDYIEAKLSTEEGEQMLKAFIEGNKKGLHASFEISKATFSTPLDSVAVDMTGIVRPNIRAIHARNVISYVPTMSNMISFLRLTADDTADGIGITAEGAQKPELVYIPEVVKVPVEKLAGYITLTDESMDDVVGLRAWFALALPEAYLRVEDDYIFNNPTYGIVPLADTWVNDGAINPWDTLISAIAQVENKDNYANAIFVSPDGKKELLRNKGLTNGMYTYPVVEGANGFTLDGLPIYSTSVFKGNEFLVGDFSASAVTYHVRKDMSIRYSEEHADNFTKNLITVLIEGRGAIAVRKPDAFVSGELVVNSTPTT